MKKPLRNVHTYWKTCPITLKHKKAVDDCPRMLGTVPDHLKARRMCNKVVKKYLWLLKYVSDWFVTHQQIKMWYDNDDYCNDDDELINWYDGYQKCKAQKALTKEELMPIAWHPSRWWDWCVPEDEKQETEIFFFEHLIC